MALHYWYHSRPNEIFLDLDSRKSFGRALRVASVWMKKGGQAPYYLPPIEAMYHYPTGREGHQHLIIVLPEDMPMSDHFRTVVALWMGSDRLRAAYVLERQYRGLGHFGDLLCASQVYHRKPDAMCMCGDKHKDRKITDKCHALKMILGPLRSADFWPRVGHRRIPPLRVPVGKIPLSVIKYWRNKSAKK